MIIANFTGEKILSNSPDAFTLFEKSRFGEKKSKIEYSNVEALYLLSKGKIKIYSNNKLLSEDKFIRNIKKKDKKN